MKEWTYKFALPLILVSLLPALIGLKLYGHQASKLERQSAQLQRQSVRLSRQARRLREDEVKTCKQVEHLKTLNRHALQEQLAESQHYLKEHPNGTRDIPRDLIERGIARTKHQIKSLAPIACQ